ncbi:ferrous iron transport protein A [Terrimicrobium sacchariphilum]|jgi:Fe2+ transport system protein FeoA|uniref:Ferrous iron transport protein A n=2 Tax=Terrimicrobium sacchariphilum TaxID=690879 RepID=A0A146G6Z8_TERSA|nr:ferrous iron transport protein A [Terrimicrobium sacchariphilum]
MKKRSQHKMDPAVPQSTGETPKRRRTVNDLAPCEQAKVTAIHHDEGMGQRLMSLGLVPGCPLQFVRSAPLGDPLMIKIPGCLLCLRRAEARLVEIEDEIAA